MPVGDDHGSSNVLAAKRYLQPWCAATRFQIRLIHSRSSSVDDSLADDAVLGSNLDLQVVVLPFVSASEDDKQQLETALASSDVEQVLYLLRRPLDPNLDLGRWHKITPISIALQALEWYNGCETEVPWQAFDLLVEAQANLPVAVDTPYGTPLCSAAAGGMKCTLSLDCCSGT